MTKKRQSFAAAFSALRATLASAYKLAPFAVVMLLLVAELAILSVLWSVTLMTAVVLLVVWGVALIVYVKTQNFGEAALALVAGLLTVFSVEWTAMRFIAFSAAWLGFTFIALLIASVRIASQVESIYRQAALASPHSTLNSNQVEDKLREIGEKTTQGQVGPVERAEILRIFAFRRVPLESMKGGLEATEMISTITALEPKRVATFVIDLTVALMNQPEDLTVVEVLNRMMKRSAVSPQEFISGFEETKHLLLSKAAGATRYFDLLQEGLQAGVAPGRVADWLEDRLDTQRRLTKQ